MESMVKESARHNTWASMRQASGRRSEGKDANKPARQAEAKEAKQERASQERREGTDKPTRRGRTQDGQSPATPPDAPASATKHPTTETPSDGARHETEHRPRPERQKKRTPQLKTKSYERRRQQGGKREGESSLPAGENGAELLPQAADGRGGQVTILTLVSFSESRPTKAHAPNTQQLSKSGHLPDQTHAGTKYPVQGSACWGVWWVRWALAA